MIMTLGRVATATLLTVGLVACSSSGGAPKGTAYAPVDGLAFQPDVVIVPEAAVRASADNGLEFDLDPRARHVKDLQVGDVLAATSLVVGRVLALTRSGSSTKVILGPIALTDLIKDGSFSSDEPVPLDGGTTVSAPALPGAVGAVGATYRAPTSGPVVENATYHAGKGDYDLAGFTITPSCCSDGAQIHIGRSDDLVHVDSTASLKIVKPTVTYHLTIGGSKLVHADLMLHGAASLEFVLKAATTDHSKGQGFPALTIPLETDIPLVVAGIPLKVSVTQAFVLKTGLIGSASLETKGSYRLDGDLGFSLDGTTPHLSIPTFTTVASLAKDMKINDVSSPTLSFGYSVRLTLGVGTIGFTAGPYLQITTGIGLAGAGNVTEFALRPCLNAAVTVDADYGVGYRISSSVLPFVNDFLKLVNVKPIPATGGPSFGPSALWHPGPYQFCLPRTTS